MQPVKLTAGGGGDAGSAAALLQADIDDNDGGGGCEGLTGHELAASVLRALIYMFSAVGTVVAFVLLQSSNTQEVRTACGHALWEFLLVRTIFLLLELLQIGFKHLLSLAFDDASGAPLDADDGGGNDNEALFHSAAAGDGRIAPRSRKDDTEEGGWYGGLIHLVYNFGFAMYATFVVPTALVDHAPCCTNALASASFTGTYTLAAFAWIYFTVDWVQVIVRGLLFLVRMDNRDASAANNRINRNIARADSSDLL